MQLERLPRNRQPQPEADGRAVAAAVEPTIWKLIFIKYADYVARDPTLCKDCTLVAGHKKQITDIGLNRKA